LYSGYVTVDEEAGRALFYAFVESSGDPKSDPVVLWLNGGPGCSSLAGGFLSELGPYYPTPKGGGLERNPYAWTQVASIIFLESPAFVGWSYSNRTEDRVVGDKRTAADALGFLLGFFQRFPQFKDRPFWIAGESYGGHYVPNLALEVVRHNEDPANAEARIELQGFLVGNAWTDADIDNEGAVDFWHSHAVISTDTSRSFKQACNFSHIGPLLAAHEDAELADLGVDPGECRAILESSAKDLEGINIYDIYKDICIPLHLHQQVTQLARTASGHPAVLGAHLTELKGHPKYDPCIDNRVEVYMNRPDVQAALHGNITSLPWPWSGCSPIVQYSQRDLFSSMLPKYAELLSKKLKILVFSGDVDGIVPVTGTRRWLQKLGLPIEKPWTTWHSTTGQVGGRIVVHKPENDDAEFHFATVRDAGHMVPYTQGERSFVLFSSFIHDKPLK
jgi:serine carboxypeptidase-like clade 2